MITLLPLFYQELLGYTALNAGMAVSPRGLGAIVAMPLIGIYQQPHRQPLPDRTRLRHLRRLRAVVRPRQSRHLAMELLWPIIISGFGAGMVFVPLATTSMASLPNEEIGNASRTLQPAAQHRRRRSEFPS